MYVGSNVFVKASVEFVSVSCLLHSSIYQVFSITTVPEPLSAGSWHTACLAGGMSSRANVRVFFTRIQDSTKEASDKRPPPEGNSPRGFRGHAPIVP